MKTSRVSTGLIASLFLFVASTQSAFASSITELDFTVQSAYEDLAVNDVVQYEDVDGAGTDARLRVVSLTNSAGPTGTADRLRRADRPGTTGIDIALRGVAPPPAPAVSAEFELKFLADATDANSAARTLTDIVVTIVDVDYGQYVTLPTPNSVELSTNPPTKITTSTSGSTTTFTGPSSGSEDEDEDYWVSVGYSSLSTLNFTVGLASGGSGGSFIISFEPLVFSPPAAPENAEASSDPEPAELPGIHLDVLGQIGSPMAEVQALFEGEGLSRGTPYTLTLASGTLLASGAVGRYGYFSETLSLAGLQPGNHTLILRTTAPDGSPLVLSKLLRVGSQGEFLNLTTVSATHTLAATGPERSTLWLAGGALGITILGLALAMAGYRLSTRHQQL